MLERIVHLMDMNQEGNLPRTYNLIKVSVLESATIKPLDPFARIDWKESLEFTQQIGDEWLASKASPLARVPSAIIRDTESYLLNPEHPDAAYVRIATVTRERFDRRLLRSGGR
jgi:RES domain-containing protein